MAEIRIDAFMNGQPITAAVYQPVAINAFYFALVLATQRTSARSFPFVNSYQRKQDSYESVSLQVIQFC